MKIILVLGILFLTSACSLQSDSVRQVLIIKAVYNSDGRNVYTIRPKGYGATYDIVTQSYHRVGEQIDILIK